MLHTQHNLFLTYDTIFAVNIKRFKYKEENIWAFMLPICS